MADENAHVPKHLTAARDRMAAAVKRRELVHQAVQQHQEKHAELMEAPPSTPPREAGK